MAEIFRCFELPSRRTSDSRPTLRRHVRAKRPSSRRRISGEADPDVLSTRGLQQEALYRVQVTSRATGAASPKVHRLGSKSPDEEQRRDRDTTVSLC